MKAGLAIGLVIPDLWQQEAIRALQQRKDVVVQAPTGSGKTYIFELLYPNLKSQAVFTVPTRTATTGSGTEPSSSTAPPRPKRVTLIPDQMIAKFMHHKRLMIRNERSRVSLAERLVRCLGGQLHLIQNRRAYFGGSTAGMSELNISTATSHRPSACLRTTVTNLP
jgi:DEAD/DEAH box helicase